jgi:hypothetical protein
VETRERWLSCSPSSFSFYKDLIGKYWAGGPSEAHGAPIHRICTLSRKMGVASVVIEDGLKRPEVAEEIAHLEEWAQVADGEVTARTFTFLFSGKRAKRDYAGIRQGAVMGQATIITFPMADGPRSYVYESIFRVPGKKSGSEQLLNNHVTVTGNFSISVGGAQHEVCGSYFCQQNGVTSICAHSAVRTLVRSLTNSLVTVPELNRMWNYSPETRSGTTDQVVQALSHFGMSPVRYNLKRNAVGPDAGWDLPALLADSASPSLLILAGNAVDHVVPILGHTMNSDEWHPIGTTLHVDGTETVSSSSMWTDHLVIHDDLLGPYYCLSKAGLMNARESRLEPKLVIAVLPPNVLVSPSQAEDFARQILHLLMEDLDPIELNKGRWWQHLLDGRERRVFRTTLIDRSDYLATLPDSDDHFWIKRELLAILPERMWMSEISVPNLFLANRAKLGEILVSTDAFPSDADPATILEAMIGFRLPSMIGWADPGEDGIYSVAEWPESAHRPIHAPSHHANWW